MKSIMCLGVLLLLVSLAQAYPAAEDSLINWGKAAISANDLQHLQIRILCDDLFGYPNHWNCVARCIASGRSNGYCNGQRVCICS